ncbi:Wall-associated receptor kinase-like 10 [Camellia lanceoleosa]|uniref:Wall-associated receptor kinase-like 10 n=1 Tax=Camellia lanceoleosa TaxID=1840588 RepID=A0ACC0HCC3_9ERIC|nr:Wall-associated receptor kinase-like 10 [Camellia lanceoleosa]
MLLDGRIITVKKSKVVNEGQVEQFINEVVIISQIVHRNIVKLLGCCLETYVPLLIYEFIPNGTLSQHIHDPNEEFPLSWELRFRIATKVAGALSYLHYAATRESRSLVSYLMQLIEENRLLEILDPRILKEG